MKKVLIGVFCLSILFGGFSSGMTVEASDANIDQVLPGNIVKEDDEFYYVLDDAPTIQTRTYSKTQSYTIKKGKRTYLGTVTQTRKYTFKIGAVVKGISVELGTSFSESGKFKKYKQEATITVKYKVYRKVDNKYVSTKTATSNTYYYDYVAI